MRSNGEHNNATTHYPLIQPARHALCERERDPRRTSMNNAPNPALKLRRRPRLPTSRARPCDRHPRLPSARTATPSRKSSIGLSSATACWRSMTARRRCRRAEPVCQRLLADFRSCRVVAAGIPSRCRTDRDAREGRSVSEPRAVGSAADPGAIDPRESAFVHAPCALGPFVVSNTRRVLRPRARGSTAPGTSIHAGDSVQRATYQPQQQRCGSGDAEAQVRDRQMTAFAGRYEPAPSRNSPFVLRRGELMQERADQPRDSSARAIAA